jgi:hypothetical protein
MVVKCVLRHTYFAVFLAVFLDVFKVGKRANIVYAKKFLQKFNVDFIKKQSLMLSSILLKNSPKISYRWKTFAHSNKGQKLHFRPFIY